MVRDKSDQESVIISIQPLGQLQNTVERVINLEHYHELCKIAVCHVCQNLITSQHSHIVCSYTLSSLPAHRSECDRQARVSENLHVRWQIVINIGLTNFLDFQLVV